MAPDAMQKALDYVNSKKWQTGRNNDGSYIAIGRQELMDERNSKLGKIKGKRIFKSDVRCKS